MTQIYYISKKMGAILLFSKKLHYLLMSKISLAVNVISLCGESVFSLIFVGVGWKQ